MTNLIENYTGLLGIGILLIFTLAMIISSIIYKNRDWQSLHGSNLRDIPAFRNLRRSINKAVETGRSIHVTLGWGGVVGPHATSTFIGLSLLRRITQLISLGDRRPLASSGDGTVAILSQDTLQNTYREADMGSRYDPIDAQVSGLTPFSYASGTAPLIFDDDFTANVLTGHFGSESALIADASEETYSLTLAGTDDLSSQAILAATTSEPLIGEEFYACGAYTQAGLMHSASLHAQDFIRWILVIMILAGVGLKFTGVW